MLMPPDRFAQCHRLMAHFDDILTECRALPDDDFAPWPETPLCARGWSVYGLVAAGREILENALFCPRTTAVLRGLPGLMNAGFSRLHPHTRIAPHTGYTGQVWRLHLGLDIPTDCGLRVKGVTARWRAGHCLAFDDTLVHEAWNHSAQARTILLVDVLKSACPAPEELA